jgi:hypothetical protein
LAAVRSILALGAALLLAACSGQIATTMEPSPVQATLSRDQVEQLMVRADDLRRQAFEFPDTANLANAFGGIALKRLRAQSESLVTRGMNWEERSPSHELVFWDPLAGEAVLQVVAEQRVISPDEPNPAWSATVRQWWARLQNVDGSWKVVDEEDLPPDRWRPGALSA